jgi:hypothetical protein
MFSSKKKNTKTQIANSRHDGINALAWSFENSAISRFSIQKIYEENEL